MSSAHKLPQEEVVIKYIKHLLYTEKLLPGERLPAERKLAETLNVSRIHVRNALRKLEFYGIIKTYPQSGSVVTQMKVQSLDRIISDVLKIDHHDFYSLVEVRVLLEKEAIKLCALNRTEEDLASIEDALIKCETYFENTDHRVDYDFAFHQAIAQACHNSVIASMLLIITPDILKYYRQHNACSVPEEERRLEHREMYNYIKKGNAEMAVKIVENHLRNIRDFAKSNNDENHFIEYSAPKIAVGM